MSKKSRTVWLQKTSGGKRAAELDELLKEVRKLVKMHEDRIKAGVISDQMVAEMKAHYAKLKEQTEKLSRELTAPGNAGTATVAGSTPSKDTAAAATSGGAGASGSSSSSSSSGKVPPPLPPKNPKKGDGDVAGGAAASGGGGGSVKIILAVIAVVAIGAGVALTVKPELLDLIITPPPKPAPSWVGTTKEEPKEGILDKIKHAANAKAEEERRKKEEEEAAAQQMMYMGIGATVLIGVVIGALVMMKSSSSQAGDSSGGDADSEDHKYGRYVKEKDTEGDEVYSSHRLDAMKKKES